MALVEPGKSAIESNTVWINGVMLIASAVALAHPQLAPFIPFIPKLVIGGQALVNLWLRIFHTKEPIVSVLPKDK